MKILNESERNNLIKKDKNAAWIYGEEYSVRYRNENGQPLEVIYYAASKGRGRQVRAKFMKDYKITDIISVVYQ